jgi:hypothetical protein
MLAEIGARLGYALRSPWRPVHCAYCSPAHCQPRAVPLSTFRPYIVNHGRVLNTHDPAFRFFFCYPVVPLCNMLAA